MENEDGNGSGKLVMIQTESPRDDRDAQGQGQGEMADNSSPSSPSSSSSSSLSSSSSSSSLSSSLPSDSPFDVVQTDVQDNSSIESEQLDLISIGSEQTSPVDFTNQNLELSIVNESPKTAEGSLSSQDVWTPTDEGKININASPMQTMDQPAGYDPNRIPASIFSSKPTTPTDWSATSNESLFSIYVGENSCCKDSFLKSGELVKFDDFMKSSTYSISENKSTEFNTTQGNLATVPEGAAEYDRRNSTDENYAAKEEVHAKPVVNLTKPSQKDNENISPRTSSSTSDGKGIPQVEISQIPPQVPRISNSSTHSASSFAFPILGGDVGKDDTENQMFEKKQSKPQITEPNTPKAPENRTNSWFSFSCCPFRCCFRIF